MIVWYSAVWRNTTSMQTASKVAQVYAAASSLHWHRLEGCLVATARAKLAWSVSLCDLAGPLGPMPSLSATVPR
jgi:hypothetical protein